MSNSFNGGPSFLQVFGFSFQSRPKQPGEGSSLLISDLNSSIKYKGGVKSRSRSALHGMSLTRDVMTQVAEEQSVCIAVQLSTDRMHALSPTDLA